MNFHMNKIIAGIFILFTTFGVLSYREHISTFEEIVVVLLGIVAIGILLNYVKE